MLKSAAIFAFASGCTVDVIITIVVYDSTIGSVAAINTIQIGAIPFDDGGHGHGPCPECLVFELDLVHHIDFPFILNGDAIILVGGPYVLLVSFQSCGEGNKLRKPNNATVKAMITFIV